MISIIICSTKPDISVILKENINDTIGVDYELIVIDNSTNLESIFSAYNKGVEQSKFSFLCFIHEDILFRTKDWGKNIIAHLNEKNTGIIGVSGGKIMTKVPASWWLAGPGCKNIIQHYKNKTTLLEVSENCSGIRQPAIVLDGVFLSLRRELFNQIRFDAELSGFHGYDHDICVQSIVAGFNNYVVFDMLIEHFSEGSMNAQYYTNLIKIHKKWQNYLPLFSIDTPGEAKKNINNTELKLLGKFIRRMVRTGFTTEEIILNTKFFIDRLANKKAKERLKFIYFTIFIERLIKAPKYLFK